MKQKVIISVFTVSFFLFCLFFFCKTKSEYKSEEADNWSTINPVIVQIVDSLYQTGKKPSFTSIKFYSSNDSNYVEFLKAIVTSKFNTLPITERPEFVGYIELNSTVSLVFFNYCSDSILHKFVQQDRLYTNQKGYDSLVKNTLISM